MLAYMQGGVARVAGRDARWPRRTAPACRGRPGRLRAHRRHRALALRRRHRLTVPPRCPRLIRRMGHQLPAATAQGEQFH